MNLRALSLLALATAVAYSGAVAADEPQPGDVPQPATPEPAKAPDGPPMNPGEGRATVVDSAQPAGPDAWAGVERNWLYTQDPTAPPPLHVVATLGAGYASIDRGAARPFAADVAHAGAVFNAGAEVGIVRLLSFEGQGLVASESPQTKQSVAGGALVGLTLHPFPAKWAVQTSLASGYLRELGGDNGIWWRAVVAGNIGRLRLGGSALAEHMFAKGRDPVDLMLSASASVMIVPWAHIGVEYVVQDLEELGDDDGDDGGVKHFVGLTASLMPVKHLQITAGPALGLATGAPSVLGRGQVSYYF